MEYCNYQYNLNNSKDVFYIFEIKIKQLDGERITLRRIKMKNEGNLINFDENMNCISSFKINVYSINDPNNEITLKDNIKQTDNNIFSNNKLILQIHNSERLIINYKFL